MSRPRLSARAAILMSVLTLLPLLVVAPAAPAVAAASVTPRVVVAMGDSISRAASADGTPADNARNSWSTGSNPEVGSHLQQLGAIAGWTPPAYNVALGGATTADLPRQAAAAVGRAADYVTILSGGNDVCRSSSVETLPSPEWSAANLAEALEILSAGRPDARIFVASIPDLRALHAAGITTRSAPLVWAAAGICPIMLADPYDASPAAEQRRAAIQRHIVAVNDAMAAACAEVRNCFDDDGAVFGLPVTPADMSTLDYFHPSIRGQAAIAAVTWQKVIEKGVLLDEPSTGAPPATDPVETVIDDSSPLISWTGDWASTRWYLDRGGSVSYIKSLGSSYSHSFTGTRVSIVSRTTASAGIGEVRIDGRVVAQIDSYSSDTRYNQVVFRSDALPNRVHTITVTALNEKAAASTGRNLILDALIIEAPGG